MGAGETVRAPRGRLFFIKSASSPLSIGVAGRPGAPIKMTNIGAGLKYGPVAPGEEWQYLELTSALAQTVELIVSDDDVEIANVVSVAGVAAVTIAPSSTVATVADVSIANGGTHSIAADAARKRITLQAPSTNTGSLRIAETGAAAAARGLELQPGMSYELATTAGLDVYNGSGASQALAKFAES